MVRRNRFSLCGRVFIAMIFWILCQFPLGVSCQELKKLITKNNLISSLKKGKSEGKNAAWYIEQIKQHGVDFRLSKSDEQKIRVVAQYLGEKELDTLFAAVRGNFKILILFAEFQSFDNQNHAVTALVIDQLRAATTPYSDTRIQYLSEPITAQQGDDVARIKGEEHGAHFVIWGWYSTSSLNAIANIHFVFVKGLDSWEQCKKANQETLKSPRKEIEDYSLQTTITNHMTYLTVFTMGLARLEARDFNGAIERFDSVLKMKEIAEQIIDPAQIYRYRGSAYLQKHNYDLAIADYNQAIKLDPIDKWAFYDRGVAYSAQGNYDQAIADATQVIRLDPTSADAYYTRGLDYLNKADILSALADFNQAISRNPNHTDAYFARGLLFKGESDYDLAIRDYNKTIELAPSYACAYNNRGVAYSLKGNDDLAITDYKKATELDPGLKMAFSNLAKKYYSRGSYLQAIPQFSRALELDPDSAEDYLYRGIANRRAGRTKEAIPDLNKAITLGTDPELRREAERELKLIKR